MSNALSKTQVDRLGERLRESALTEADLKLLDEYRLTFGAAYEHVVRTIREQLHLEPSGRSAKSTSSVIDKLRRESIRLSQMQDLAGCRLVVEDVAEQDGVVARLRVAFPNTSVLDRRVAPSHGYRAVHVVVEELDRLVEIQVRTALQHLWAEMSEKVADSIDPQLKYGKGDPEVRQFLRLMSVAIASAESIPAEEGAEVAEARQRTELKEWLTRKLRAIVAETDRLKGEEP